MLTWTAKEEMNDSFAWARRFNDCREGLRIQGKNVTLVPYGPSHVPVVNRWLKNDRLRELVSARPLSLADEYKQQEEWSNDETKRAFIICRRQRPRRKKGRKGREKNSDAIEKPVGTVDLFIYDETDSSRSRYGEVIIMIAERRWRRRGVAREAVAMAVKFGIVAVGLDRIVAKIMDTNQASIAFFTSMGFQTYEHDDDFDMTHMHLLARDAVDAFPDGAYSCRLSLDRSLSSSRRLLRQRSLARIGEELRRVLDEQHDVSIRGTIERVMSRVRDFCQTRAPREHRNTVIVGEKAVLVPYASWHVRTYHEWMRDPYILKMTSSEPLTIEQEYGMQKMWNSDPLKRTFIVLCKDRMPPRKQTSTRKTIVVDMTTFRNELREIMEEYEIEDEDEGVEETIKQFRERETSENVWYDLSLLALSESYRDRHRHGTDLIGSRAYDVETKAMAGDVNLFISDDGSSAEVSVMVVPKSFRRLGLATEATLMMIRYATLNLGVSTFYAKISKDNDPSIRMFETRLGFVRDSVCDAFDEIHFVLRGAQSIARVLEETRSSAFATYASHLHRHQQ